MVRAYVSLGSNIERERHIPVAVGLLRVRYPQVQISSVYESEAVGFEGDRFFNVVIGFEPDAGVSDTLALLRAIEDRCGRAREGPRFSSRTLDADLLLFGDLVIDGPELHLPRREVLTEAFVLCPLAEIAGERRHPVLGRTYAELWETFAGDRNHLWPVSFDLDEAVHREMGGLAAPRALRRA